MVVLAVLGSIVSVPVPCFSKFAVVPLPEATTGAVLNTTLLLPRFSLAAVPATISSLTAVVLPASQRTVALLATARVAPEGKALFSRPMVEPAPALMRISPLNRLELPPMTQVPVPATVRF